MRKRPGFGGIRRDQADDWQEVAAPLVEPILRQARRDPAALGEALAALYPAMSTEAIQARLSRAVFVADTWARAGGESRPPAAVGPAGGSSTRHDLGEAAADRDAALRGERQDTEAVRRQWLPPVFDTETRRGIAYRRILLGAFTGRELAASAVVAEEHPLGQVAWTFFATKAVPGAGQSVNDRRRGYLLYRREGRPRG